ncbi:MAG: hypothetical protein HC936_01120 [Leptolyngbyaceae cyanobacterium SU_3_3]|nr:hypothetical protein [Leptolyngbyaceae cyanobacterium SU_3_3]
MADGGGEIQINAEGIKIQEGSRLLAGIDEGSGNRDSKAGDIILDATGNIEVSRSSIQNALFGRGASGDLVIRARSLVLNKEAILLAATASQGNAGQVKIQVADSVILTESAKIFNVIDLG